MTVTRILVVEDEQIVAEDLKMTLETLGYRVVGIASSGERAIELAETEKPDLILMDIMLAGKMDGISAASQIHGSHDIPVIYVTAYADSTLLDRAKQTEPYGYIVKPFNEREIQSNIEIALFKHRMELVIKKRDAILLALGFGVEWFLRQFSDSHRITRRGVPGRWGYDFDPILEQIGIAMNLDRISVFRFRPENGGLHSMTLVSEWTTHGMAPIESSEGDNVITSSMVGISGSIHDLQSGNPVSYRLEDIPENEQGFLVGYNIHIALAIPVFVRDRIWGMVLFSNGEEREYSSEEVEAMKIAVNIIGGVISLYVSEDARSSGKSAV